MPLLRLALIALTVFAVCTFTASANETPTQVPSLTLTILDESGTPIPNAKFSYSGNPRPHGEPTHRRFAETDESGRFVIELNPGQPQRSLSITIESPGYDFFLADWGGRDANIENDPIPAEFSVKLKRAATVGGVVLDGTGKPLANASVDFIMPWGERSRVRQVDHFVHGVRNINTDENGIWRYASVPTELLGTDARFTFTHPDHVRLPMQLRLGNLVPTADGTFTQSVRMEQGLTARGRVTDTEGNPVVGAIVVGRNEYFGSGGMTRAETDENGEYSLRNWSESRSAYIGVWKAGMMAALKSFPVQQDNPPVVDFTMKPAGKPVTIKIVNRAGEPIEGFYLAIERWGEQRLVDAVFLTGSGRPRTDEHGRWTWNEAPDEEVVFDMFRTGHMSIRQRTVIPRDEEYVFVSEDPLNITGSVTDAETGEIIPTFNVYLGTAFSGHSTHWDIRRGAGANGTYRISETEARERDVAIRIEADGYVTATSRNIASNEGSITIDFALTKLPPEQARGIYGTVLLPDGRPATNVTVAMATHRSFLQIQNGRLQHGREPYTIFADREGNFRFAHIDFEAEAQNRHFPPGRQRVDFILFFLHDSGFKRLTQQEWESLDEDKTITLEPWARIEGTVKVGTQPGKDLPVQSQVMFSTERFMSAGEPHVFIGHNATADDTGKFTFERVPPSFVAVSRTIRFNDTGRGHSSTSSHLSDRIELKPGETATVTIGGIGRPVIARLQPSEEFETPPDWTFSHITATPTPERIDFASIQPELEKLREAMMPKEILEEEDRMKQMELTMAWIETEDGKKFQAAVEEIQKEAMAAQERNLAKQVQRRVSGVSSDGTFRLDDMPEGDWTLTVQLDSPPPTTEFCGPGEQIGRLVYDFTVPVVPDGVSDEPLDLGTLIVQQLARQNPMPRVGEAAPEFEIVKIEPLATDETYEDTGERLRLSDYRGKYVILDFWATWCGPCLAKMPELKTLYDKIKDDDRFVLIGISLDEAGSETMLGRFIARREMPWLHGLSGNWQSDTVRTYGINAIPALLLIDPDGKVLLSNPSMAELARKIDELRGR